MKDQEKFAGLPRQRAAPAKGIAGTKQECRKKYGTFEAPYTFFLIPGASLKGLVQLMGTCKPLLVHLEIPLKSWNDENTPRKV